MLFSDLPHITAGRILNLTEDMPVDNLLVDSRKVIPGRGSVFFALRGERFDGHDFIYSLYNAGIRQFIIERDIDTSRMPGANILRVDHTIWALQSLVRHRREKFSMPVIGITGSNGKTIVKEWLFQLLSRDYVITKNPGSYNSQVGVPLSVWQIHPNDQLCIFEAGISQPGEMEWLERVIQPSIGIFTNIGSAHDEGFESQVQKAREKVKLFPRCKAVIYCADHTLAREALDNAGVATYSWSLHGNGDVNIRAEADTYLVAAGDTSFTISLPFRDSASVENVLHCTVVMLYLKYHPSVIAERVMMLQAVPMRMELKEGINQCQIIDDSYNNDILGLRISLDFLRHQKQKKRKRLILSDILQSGLSDEALTKQIADMVTQSGVEAITVIGPAMRPYKEFFPADAEFFPDTDSFLSGFQPSYYHDEVILIKGARVFQFEKIVSRLQRKVHGTVMEIDLGALVHNLNYFRRYLPDGTRIMVMVKAFGYGSGSIEIANVLQYHKVDFLGVAFADEGAELRRNNIEARIMVMNPTEESFGELLRHRLEPEIYNLAILKALISYLDGQSCVIHIKLDTGMHRLGFEEGDLDELITALRTHPNIEVGSIFSHLAGADSADHDVFSREQGMRFESVANKITANLGYKPIYHLLNTSGILRHPTLHFDMVRLGIGLYGIDPTGGHPDLRPVVTLKTIISQIRMVKKGETVGYGRSQAMTRDTKIATLAIGYADGFRRAFSDGVGGVLINGQLAPVVGKVCMDMTMVDLTGIEAQEGQEAIIFGPGLSIESLAQKAGTIPYEILTNTSERVKRVFVAESI